MIILLVFAILVSAVFGEEMQICVKKSKHDYGMNEIIDEQISLEELKLWPYSCRGVCPCHCMGSNPIEAEIKVLTSHTSKKTLIVKHDEDVHLEVHVNWGDGSSDRYVLEPSKGGALVHNYEGRREHTAYLTIDGLCRDMKTEEIKIPV